MNIFFVNHLSFQLDYPTQRPQLYLPSKWQLLLGANLKLY